jgi:hypothetical protein
MMYEKADHFTRLLCDLSRSGLSWDIESLSVENPGIRVHQQAEACQFRSTVQDPVPHRLGVLDY